MPGNGQATPEASRTNAYVDGFNLYYRLLRGNPRDTKWLDPRALVRELLPGVLLGTVHYFTARIKSKGSTDSAPQRQQFYLRALEASPQIEVHEGYFQINKVKRQRTDLSGYVEVWNPEEKGSDVNLASMLIRDAALGLCSRAVVISNDADLATPIKVAQDDFGVQVVLAFPTSKPSRVLMGAGPSQALRISVSAVRKSQLPAVVSDGTGGTIHKPAAW